MGTLWPWLVVAGLGALHGLNPATGWMLAAVWGLRARDRAQAWHALVPIALGHAAAVALVAAAVALGMSMDRSALQVLAGALIVVGVGVRLSGRAPRCTHAPAGHAALALWSFMMASAHGAGLMLVPALMPLCLGDAATPADAGPLAMALAAVGVHTAAMLVVTGVVASGACRAALRWMPGLVARSVR